MLPCWTWMRGSLNMRQILFLLYMMGTVVSHHLLSIWKLTKGSQGSTVARFAGSNVHKRLVSEETYQGNDYEAALKRAFLGTDEDLLGSERSFQRPVCC